MNSRPQIELVAPRDLGPREWGVETLIAQGDGYIGKRLDMRAGTAGGLQYHVEKDETFMLIEGHALVESDDGTGHLKILEMQPGMVVHVPKGAPHRVTAVTDCTFYEWSNDVFNDRVRVETEYGETIDGGLPTTAG